MQKRSFKVQSDDWCSLNSAVESKKKNVSGEPFEASIAMDVGMVKVNSVSAQLASLTGVLLNDENQFRCVDSIEK